MHTIILPELAGTTGRPLTRGLYKALRTLGNLFAMMFGMVPIIFLLQVAMGKLNMDAQGLLILFLVFLVFAVLTGLCWALARILPGRLFTPSDWFLTMAEAFKKNDYPGMKAAANPLTRINVTTAQEHLFVALAHEVLARATDENKHWGAAAGHYGEAASLGLETPSLKVRHACALDNAGDPDQVVSYIQKIENSADAASELWFIKVNAFMKKGDVDGARQTLEHLLARAGRWPGEEEKIRADAMTRLAHLDTTYESGQKISSQSGAGDDVSQWLDRCGEKENGWRKIIAVFGTHPLRTNKILSTLREGRASERGLAAGSRAVHEYRSQNVLVILGLIVIGSILAWGGSFLFASAIVAITEGKSGPGFFDRGITPEGIASFLALVMAVLLIGLVVLLIAKQLVFHYKTASDFPVQAKTKVLAVACIAALAIGALFVTIAMIDTATKHRAVLVDEGIIETSIVKSSTSFWLGTLQWKPKETDLAQAELLPQSYHEMIRTEKFATLEDHARTLEKLKVYMIPGDRGTLIFSLVRSVEGLGVTVENLLDERQREIEEANRKGANLSIEELAIITFIEKDALQEIINGDNGHRERSLKILLNSGEYVEYRMVSFDPENAEFCDRLYRLGLESIGILD